MKRDGVAGHSRPLRDVLLVAVTMLVVTVIAAFVLAQMPGRSARPGGAWFAGTTAHPTLGSHFAPGTRLRAFYPDNPRGYFTEENSLLIRWQLAVHDIGSRAILDLRADDRGVLRVSIGAAPKAVAWHVQLNQANLEIRKGDTYSLSFRARADARRPISFGVSQAHPPWQNLGLYQQVVLDTTWGVFEAAFVASDSDSRTRLHFDLGMDESAVELAEITLRAVAGNELLEPAVAPEYSVTYRFNDLGCRGPDYTLGKRPGVRRLLVLGDSYAMGAGVREEDTFGAQLEHRLNGESARDGTRTEVITCGVPGWGTREQRLFYEESGSRYAPDIVVLTAVWNDDRRWKDDAPRGYNRPAVRFERQAMAPSLATLGDPGELSGRREWPADALNEIEQLREVVHRQGARLVVVLFRTSHDAAWERLGQAVAKLLAGTEVPVVDLGPALLDRATPRELVVHETYDAHPNEFAHAIAADTVCTILAQTGLLGSLTSRCRTGPPLPGRRVETP